MSSYLSIGDMNQICENNNHIPIIEIMCKLSSVKAGKLGAHV